MEQLQSKQTNKEVLLAAANLLEEKDWTQKAYAKDSYGMSVSYSSENATCYCALGSMWRVAKITAHYYAFKYIPMPEKSLHKYLVSIKEPGFVSIAQWNDEPVRTKEDVINAMRNCAATL